MSITPEQVAELAAAERDGPWQYRQALVGDGKECIQQANFIAARFHMAALIAQQAETIKRLEAGLLLCRAAVAEVINRWPESDAALFLGTATGPLAPITDEQIVALNAPIRQQSEGGAA